MRIMETAQPNAREARTDEELLTAAQASQLLQLSISGLYRLVQLRKIPYHRPGGKRLLFFRNELLHWVCGESGLTR